MIDVDAATRFIELHFPRLGVREVALKDLAGKVLAQDIFSLRDQPPFHRVAMDGIAISFAALSAVQDGQLPTFFVEKIQKAGEKPCVLSNSNNAIEVMTGAPLPLGTDTVIPYEWLSLSERKAVVLTQKKLEIFKNVHRLGSDYQNGSLLLRKGQKLTAPLVNVIASQGKKSVEVFSLPRVALVSTGDELVAPGRKCKEWQIWSSNVFALKTALSFLGFSSNEVKMYHLADDRSKMFRYLRSFLKKFDFVIATGGVSKGKFDFAPEIIKELGLQIHFHHVAQKPGKPMLFATSKNQCFFGLPGNPVSALICFQRYVAPALKNAMKMKSGDFFSSPIKVALMEQIIFEKSFTLFQPAQLKMDEKGRWFAQAVKMNGSGDFFSLAGSEGFIELPSEKKVYNQGEMYDFYPWGGILC